MRHLKYVVLRMACIGAALADGEADVPFQPKVADTPAAGVQVPEYRFGVEPMSSTGKLWRRYSRFTGATNASVSGFSIRIDSALDVRTYERKLRAGGFDIILVEPHRVLEIERLNYRVFARAGPDDHIDGLIVVRRDGRIEKLGDVYGKILCFGAPNALASTLLPRMWLREAGFSERRANILFTGSDDTALFHVWRGLADAAAVSGASWGRFVADHPDASSLLKPKWRTHQLSGVAIMSHRRVPPQQVRQLALALVHLEKTETGRKALSAIGVKSLRAADESSYDDVWEFLTNYARLFGHHAPGVRQ